ncbi:unnamed protein product [Arabidopsis lyrata]|nr:unnamed protein product [Arabidopsis lyrata]CAH8263779.1 unnamed protein product [Arabidopsis lyrata]
MFDIKKNALKKLSKQHSAYRIKLLSSYKEMVAVVVEMVNASRSLRCYTKLGTESLVQFSCSKEDSSDAGDCGGIPVFNFWNVSTFALKFLNPSTTVGQMSFTMGNLSHLTKCSFYSMEVAEPVLPRVKENNFGISSISHTNQPTVEILQVLYVNSHNISCRVSIDNGTARVSAFYGTGTCKFGSSCKYHHHIQGEGGG